MRARQTQAFEPAVHVVAATQDILVAAAGAMPSLLRTGGRIEDDSSIVRIAGSAVKRVPHPAGAVGKV